MWNEDFNLDALEEEARREAQSKRKEEFLDSLFPESPKKKIKQPKRTEKKEAVQKPEKQPKAKQKPEKQPKAKQKLRKKAKKRLNPALKKLIRLVALALATVILLSAAWTVLSGDTRLFDSTLRKIRYGGQPLTFRVDGHTANHYLSLKRGLAAATPNGLIYYNRKGEERFLASNPGQQPMLLCNQNTALGYCVGGNRITTIHYLEGQLQNFEVPGTLQDADISDDGYLAYITNQTAYKSVLHVCTAEGNAIFTWYSSTRFFQHCALSSDGSRLVGITIGRDGNSFQSDAVFFATTQEDPTGTLRLGEDLYYEMDFRGDNQLCAVGQSGLEFFDTQGTLLNTVSYETGSLCAYSLDSQEFLVILTEAQSGEKGYCLTALDNEGETLATVTFEKVPVDFSANGNYLALLTGDALYVYDRKLHLCWQSTNIGSASRVCVQSDGAALLIDGSTVIRVSGD